MTKHLSFRALTIAFTISGCASLVNDSYIPIKFSFSDESTGQCQCRNKRGEWIVTVPGSVMIRRSDDNLKYICETSDGRTTIGEVHSGVELSKIGLLDFGMTDSITDKHRTYLRSVVVPIEFKK